MSGRYIRSIISGANRFWPSSRQDKKEGAQDLRALGLSPLPTPCRPLQSPILFHASPTPADKKISFSHTDHFIWPGMAASNLREMAGATRREEGYLGEEPGRLGAARRPTGRTSKGRQSMRIRRCPVPPPPPPRPARCVLPLILLCSNRRGVDTARAGIGQVLLGNGLM